jgi:hypothetical protein
VFPSTPVFLSYHIYGMGGGGKPPLLSKFLHADHSLSTSPVLSGFIEIGSLSNLIISNISLCTFILPVSLTTAEERALSSSFCFQWRWRPSQSPKYSNFQNLILLRVEPFLGNGSKHVLAVTDTNATIEVLLETLFPVGPCKVVIGRTIVAISSVGR